MMKIILRQLGQMRTPYEDNAPDIEREGYLGENETEYQKGWYDAIEAVKELFDETE